MKGIFLAFLILGVPSLGLSLSTDTFNNCYVKESWDYICGPPADRVTYTKFLVHCDGREFSAFCFRAVFIRSGIKACMNDASNFTKRCYEEMNKAGGPKKSNDCFLTKTLGDYECPTSDTPVTYTRALIHCDGKPHHVFCRKNSALRRDTKACMNDTSDFTKRCYEEMMKVSNQNPIRKQKNKKSTGDQ